MTEEKATATTRARTASTIPAKMDPESAPTGIEKAERIEKKTALVPTVSASELRAYVEWRRSQIYKPRLGGQIGGSAAIRAQSANIVLTELEELANWLENGRPGPLQALADTDKDFYREAASRGLEIPAGILEQL